MNFKELASQYINGEWKDGSSDLLIENKNPYKGDINATYKAASILDLNDAYESAQNSQEKWAKTNPVVQREVFNKAVDFIKENHEAMVDVIIDEIGGRRLTLYYPY